MGFLPPHQEQDYFLSPSMHYFASVDTEFHLPSQKKRAVCKPLQAALGQKTVNNFVILCKVCHLHITRSLVNTLNRSDNTADL